MPARHVLSVTRVLWLELMRTGPDAATRVRMAPIVEILGTMTLLGCLYAATASRFADAGSYFILLFCYVATMLAFTILPDTVEVRDKRLEIVRPSPVSGRTFFAAETLNLFALVVAMTTGFAVPALGWARLTFAVSWPEIVTLFGALVVCSLSVVLVFFNVTLVAARWLDLLRLRLVTQFCLVLLVLGAFLLSAGTEMGVLTTNLLSFEGSWVLSLPPAWFADAVWRGSPGSWLGSILVVAISGLVYWRFDPDALYRRLAEGSAPRREKGLARRFLEIVAPAAYGQSASVAGLTLAVSRREETSWLRGLSLRLFLVLFFGLALWRNDGMMSSLLLAQFAFISVLDGVVSFSQSVTPEASWIFRASPLAPGAIQRGVRWAVLLRCTAFPALLMAIQLGSSYAPGTAAALLVAFLVVCGLLQKLRLRNFGVPLSVRANWSMAGFFPSVVLGTLALFVYSVLFVAFARVGLWVGAILLAPFALGNEIWRRRLARG